MKSTRNRPALETLADLLAKQDNFLLACHTNPDGDALGSMLALGQGLKLIGKNVSLYSRDGVPSLYDFLPGAGEVADNLDLIPKIEVAILLDCHNLKRAGASAIQPPVLAVLDHHQTNGSAPETGVIDSASSSTGELVYYLLSELGIAPTLDMGVNLFAAISTDTGSFNYDNTTAESLKIAAELVESGVRPWEIYKKLNLNMPAGRLNLLGQALEGIEFYYQGRLGVLSVTSEMMAATATSDLDTEGFINYPRSVEGVELAILIRENGHHGKCHVSLRSRGGLNVADLADKYGGGGHHNAAGFSIAGSVDEVKKRVIPEAGFFLFNDPRE